VVGVRAGKIKEGSYPLYIYNKICFIYFSSRKKNNEKEDFLPPMLFCLCCIMLRFFGRRRRREKKSQSFSSEVWGWIEIRKGGKKHAFEV
jgi:hypothetical protein